MKFRCSRSPDVAHAGGVHDPCDTPARSGCQVGYKRSRHYLIQSEGRIGAVSGECNQCQKDSAHEGYATNVRRQGELVAVVTGAGRGIGRAIAIELGRLGARVVLAARTRTELEETARAIGGKASVVAADVREKDELQRLFEQVTSAIGPVDILVNAAGLGIFGPVVDAKDSAGARTAPRFRSVERQRVSARRRGRLWCDP